MLTLTIKGNDEMFNSITNEFYPPVKDHTLVLEHSLVSLSKWEAKWEKPFISDENKTYAETIDYIRCMTITQNVDPNIYLCITQEHIDIVSKYMDAKMTAATFHEYERGDNKSKNKEFITSETIYYWMITLNIPMQCEKWHLNRLMALIRFISIKNQPDNKLSKKETYASNRTINEQRRKLLNSKG